MEQNHKKVFSFTQIDPPEDLLPRIITRIALLERRVARMRLSIFLGTTTLSLVAVVASFRYAWESFAQSSFSTYTSLLSSDGSALLLYWKEFLFSLVESLPIMSITVLLSTIFLLILSFKLMLHYLKDAYVSHQFNQFA